MDKNMVTQEQLNVIFFFLFIKNLSKTLSKIKQTISKDAKKELEEWPMELINWNVKNNDRYDIAVNLDDADKNASIDIIRKSERAGSLKWNGN